MMENTTQERTVLETLNDIMRFASSRRIFEIVRAELDENGEKRDIYLVAMRGTNQSRNPRDPLSLNTCLQAFMGHLSNYLYAVKKAMLAEIPQGATVALVGHSLGGMIAQQLAADETVNATFHLLNALAIGSPFVPVKGRVCPLHRFADKADFIPWLGFSVKANLKTAKPVFESNGYLGKPVLAHTDSYRNAPSWMRYDPFGDPDGGRRLTLLDSRA